MKTCSHAFKIPLVGSRIWRSSPLTRFWKATSPVKRKALDDIPVYTSTFRRLVVKVFAEAFDASISCDSSHCRDIQFVTTWQVEILVEQRETRNAVSSLVAAIARSGISLLRSDKSYNSISISLLDLFSATNATPDTGRCQDHVRRGVTHWNCLQKHDSRLEIVMDEAESWFLILCICNEPFRHGTKHD